MQALDLDHQSVTSIVPTQGLSTWSNGFADTCVDDDVGQIVELRRIAIDCDQRGKLF